MNSTNYKNIDFHSFPDELGRFGNYGGRFVAETLMPLLIDVEKVPVSQKSKSFNEQLNYYFSNYVGRPSPLYLPKDFQKLNNAKIYLKRDELTTLVLTKLIIMLVKYFLQLEWGKRIVAETGAGQHGYQATATVCALLI